MGEDDEGTELGQMGVLGKKSEGEEWSLVFGNTGGYI